MKINRFKTGGLTVMTVLSVSLTGGLALAAPMTPELAAKGARVKTQQSQKITQAQRQAAADAIKAERLKLYQAQQGEGAQPAGQTPEPLRSKPGNAVN